MAELTSGNSAKLYCLRWIGDFVAKRGGKAAILDLGCGAALNFVELLKRNPGIHYVGLDPSMRACEEARKNLDRLNATIHHSSAYAARKLLDKRFDLVVSFSVLEHVRRRLDYLVSAKACLKEGGAFLINYDAGHFLSGKETLKNLAGPLLALLGNENYYQSFVREADFRALLAKAGFRILDEKCFNTRLKGLYNVIPSQRRDEFMNRWLEFELWINQQGLRYEDSMAASFETRNFILGHA